MGKLELSELGLKDRAAWEAAGYALPQYDREAMIAETKAAPTWLHFGAGNIFKAFQANAAQKLLNQGIFQTGIIAVERTTRCEDSHDGYTVLVTLKADGQVEKTVIGSIAETCYLYGGEERLEELFKKPSLQMVSFTITEKGYSLVDGKGEILPDVAEDLANGPAAPKSYMAKLTALLYARYQVGAAPLAMVSMDNCSHNGDKLYAAISSFAKAWSEKGLVEAGFAAYIADGSKVSFPWSMIDKITPSPDLTVGDMLEKDGLEGFAPVVTPRGTHVAPFVNAEESEYLVIEDRFPNGRPALDKAGIYFTDRETVDKVERMKVCTCLNPLHTTLAVYGCLLGYKRIYEEMKDAELRRLIEIIGYKEGLPVVTNPGIINPRDFIDTVLKVRLPNPFMPDMPQRIATDTSQKLPIRFGETIKAYMASDRLDVADLKLIPLVFAGWLRYLMAIDDAGNALELSPDPMLETVRPFVQDFALGQALTVEELMEKLSALLKNSTIFGVDLVANGMAKQVCSYFKELTAGVGAVRATLKKYTA